MLFRHRHRCSSHIAGPAAWIKKCARTQHTFKSWKWNAPRKTTCLSFFYDSSARKTLSFIINKQIRHTFLNFGSNSGLFFNNINKPYMFLCNMCNIFDAALDAGHKYTATDKARELGECSDVALNKEMKADQWKWNKFSFRKWLQDLYSQRKQPFSQQWTWAVFQITDFCQYRSVL